MSVGSTMYYRAVSALAIFTLLLISNVEANTASGQSNPYHLAGGSGILTLEECMSCHDRTSAKPIYICTGDMCLYSRNHSLMREYPPLGQEKDYASIAEIEAAGCVLEKGRTTCLSCHDLTKPPPARTIKDGYMLCFICHKYLASRL